MSVLDTLIVGKRYLETVKLGDVVFEMGNLDAEEELEAMRYVDASASSIHSFNSTKRYLVVQAVESINGIPVSRASDARSALLSKINQMPLESILRLYDATGFQSPRPEDVPGLVNGTPETVRRLLELLYHDQRLIRLSPAVVLTRDLFREAQARVVKLILETGAVDSAEFKHHIGSTRKYALAILDYLDARKVTVRAGNLRKLAPNYEARLV